jgi:glutathione S-transferase
MERREAYRRSTLGKSLDEVGFIHCSFASQVGIIADLVYQGRRDVLLLTIDPLKVQASILSENLEGGEDTLPHIYGELPIEAVVRADQVPVDIDGNLIMTDLVSSD